MRFTQRPSDPLVGKGLLLRVMGLAIILACLAVPLTEYWGKRGAQHSAPSGPQQQQAIQLHATSVECPPGAPGGEGQEQQAQELASLKERLKELEKAKAAAEERAKSGEQQAQELAGLRAQITQLEAAKAAAEQRAKAAASPLQEGICPQPGAPVNESKLNSRHPKWGWHCKLLRDACLDQGRVLVHSGVKTPGHPAFKDEVFKLVDTPAALVLAGYPEPSGQAHYMPVSKFEMDIRAPSTLDPPDVRTPRNFNNCTVPLVFAPHYHTIFADWVLWKLNSLAKMAKEGVYDYDSVQFVVDSNGMDLPPFYNTTLRPFSKHAPLSLAAISSRARIAEGHSRCYSQLMLCHVSYLPNPKKAARAIMEWYKKEHPDKFVADEKVFRVTMLMREGKFRQIRNMGTLLEQCKQWQLPPGSRFTSVECSTLSNFSAQNFPNIMAQVERTHALVGIHGSGLVYGYFLPNGSAMVEIICSTFCGSWPDFYYKWQMEGHPFQQSGYFRITADTDHCSPGPWERENKGSPMAYARDRDITVEFSALAQALSKIALGRVWDTDFATERNIPMNKPIQPCPHR